MKNSIEKKLEQFLKLYWLRPENGLLATFKSNVFADLKIKPPSLDLSCGDGLFLFLHLEGEVDDLVDYFLSTKADEFSHTGKFVDIFDSYDPNYNVSIKKLPDTKIDYGLDWKQQLLNKASKLNLYEKLILHDTTKTPLPFQNNQLKTIHSNSVYWVNNPENLLSDLYRILQPNGSIILELMTPYHHQTYADIQKYLNPTAISILDRARRASMPGIKTFDEWKKIILNCGFKIINTKPVYPNRLIVDISNLGLRPISHLLIQMSQSLPPEKRLEMVEVFWQYHVVLVFHINLILMLCSIIVVSNLIHSLSLYQVIFLCLHCNLDHTNQKYLQTYLYG